MKTYWTTAAATALSRLAQKAANNQPMPFRKSRPTAIKGGMLPSGRALATMIGLVATAAAGSAQSALVPATDRTGLTATATTTVSAVCADPNGVLRTGAYNYRDPSKGTLTFNGIPAGSPTRCYILYIPQKAIDNYKNPSNPQKAPLVILFHGGNSSYVGAIQPAQPGNTLLSGVSSSLWITTATSSGESLAVANGIVVAVPNGINDATDDSTDTSTTKSIGQPESLGDNQHWNDCTGINPGFNYLATGGNVASTTSSHQLRLWNDKTHYYAQTNTYTAVDDVQFIKNMIADIKGKVLYNNTSIIDTTRIYAVGASNGSNMAMRLAREDSSEIAAIAATLGGDAAIGGIPGASSTYSLSGSGTPQYQNTQEQRGSGDPTACREPRDSQSRANPPPVFLLKGVPAPSTYKVSDSNAKTAVLSGDNFILFNGGCVGEDSSGNITGLSGVYAGDGTGAYGCWLPYDSGDTYNAATAQFGYSATGASAPSTLTNWLTRNNLVGVPPTSIPQPDSKSDDGSVNLNGALAADSKYNHCYDYNPGLGNELEYCVVYRDGHVDPSSTITIGLWESTFGNENQDFDTTDLQWKFLKDHYVDSTGTHH